MGKVIACSHLSVPSFTGSARSGEPCQVMGRFVLKKALKGTLHPMQLLHRLGWWILVMLIMAWNNPNRQDQFWTLFFKSVKIQPR